MLTVLPHLARRVAVGDPEAGPRDPRTLGQDEDPRGTAHRLPAAHHGPKGVSLRQGRTLQHASG